MLTSELQAHHFLPGVIFVKSYCPGAPGRHSHTCHPVLLNPVQAWEVSTFSEVLNASALSEPECPRLDNRTELNSSMSWLVVIEATVATETRKCLNPKSHLQISRASPSLLLKLIIPVAQSHNIIEHCSHR